MHDVAYTRTCTTLVKHAHEGGRERRQRAGSGRRGQFHICYEHKLINTHIIQTDGKKQKKTKSKKVRFWFVVNMDFHNRNLAIECNMFY
jgi:hypothetical protein